MFMSKSWASEHL